MDKILKMSDGYLWKVINKDDAADLLYSSSIPIFKINTEGVEFQIYSYDDILKSDIIAVEVGYYNKIEDFIYPNNL